MIDFLNTVKFFQYILLNYFTNHKYLDDFLFENVILQKRNLSARFISVIFDRFVTFVVVSNAVATRLLSERYSSSSKRDSTL